MSRNKTTETMLAQEAGAGANPANKGRRMPSSHFAIRNLSVLAYANGFTLWHYKGVTLNDIPKPDYFADAADMLAAGDMLMVSAKDGCRIFCVTQTGSGSTPVLVSRLS